MARAPRPVDPFEQMAAAMPDFDEEVARTLRQLGAMDPPPGAPMDVIVTPGGQPEPIAPGDWWKVGARSQRTGLPINCPVTPLGKDGDTCYFLDTLGAVAGLVASSSGKGPIGYLFAGRSGFLEWAWPRFGRKRKDGSAEVVGWEADNARQALVDGCAWVGQFALEDQVRGRGAWRDDDGGLIYHAGNEVFIGGKWRTCGEHGRFIYPARSRIERPSARPQPAGPGSPGDFLLELLRTFNWDRGELDARLMLGWVMTAKIGGALDRRPVVFVNGAEGSGKSVLHDLVRGVMNGALIASSNTTQAGVYQRLQQDSVAIMVDELEAKDDTRTVDKILELARIAYSGDKMQRGGKDGVGKEFALRSSFMGSSISKPATDAQDDSRMAVLMLRERERAGDRPDWSLNEIDAQGRHLLRRLFDWWPRWAELNQVFRALMIELGHSDRACDTFAPLAAGAHVALFDELPDEVELEQWRAWLKPTELAETATREKTWRRCLVHLLDAQPEVFRSRHYKSVGAVLDAFKQKPDFIGDLEDYLPQVGLALSFRRGETQHTWDRARLFVPAKSAALHALYAGTPWAGRPAAPGPWVGVLRQMPRELWENGKSDKGLDRKASGLFINLADALEA
jgi:hypothetical protein